MKYSEPLRWPTGTPRIIARKGGPFVRLNPPRVLDELEGELRRLGASYSEVTTNAGVLKGTGRPSSDALDRNLEDPGVAIYLRRRDRDLVFTLDHYFTALSNLRGLTLAIGGMRTIERYGGAAMEDRALAGFAMLPSGTPTTRHWSTVIGVETIYRAFKHDPGLRGELLDVVEMRFKSLARSRHPDGGGSSDAFVELNAAVAAARKELTP